MTSEIKLRNSKHITPLEYGCLCPENCTYNLHNCSVEMLAVERYLYLLTLAVPHLVLCNLFYAVGLISLHLGRLVMP